MIKVAATNPTQVGEGEKGKATIFFCFLILLYLAYGAFLVISASLEPPTVETKTVTSPFAFPRFAIAWDSHAVPDSLVPQIQLDCTISYRHPNPTDNPEISETDLEVEDGVCTHGTRTIVDPIDSDLNIEFPVIWVDASTINNKKLLMNTGFELEFHIDITLPISPEFNDSFVEMEIMQEGSNHQSIAISGARNRFQAEPFFQYYVDGTVDKNYGFSASYAGPLSEGRGHFSMYGRFNSLTVTESVEKSALNIPAILGQLGGMLWIINLFGFVFYVDIGQKASFMAKALAEEKEQQGEEQGTDIEFAEEQVNEQQDEEKDTDIEIAEIA